MRNKILFGLFVVISYSGFTQQNNWCGFDSQNAKLNAENPYRAYSIHKQITQITSGVQVREDRSDPIIIPVVVHIIHDGGNGNIDFTQIQSGIDMLNEDYSRTNADAINTRNTGTAPFEPIAANPEIQFELAKKDPNGNCTNGVERRYSPTAANNADNNAKHFDTGGLDAWNRNQYMNIWVVNSIQNDGSTGTILGYAEFPYSGGSSNYGVIIRHDAYGTTGTASGDRTLTHEIGHCLGLYHTFQGGCNNSDCSNHGDYCCDTPPESEAHWSCGNSQNSCNNIPTNDAYGFDALDQWENYMSYAPCQNMFSEDQKSIMSNNLSNINFLSNLVSLSNQNFTGVNLPDVLCEVNFSTSKTVICAGETINFADESFNSVTGRNWTFTGGTPATSSSIAPSITYNTPGLYSVSLQATDGSTTLTNTTSNYILVMANPGESLPYSEGFETLTTFPDLQHFTMTNEDNAEAWQLTTDAAASGSKCLKLYNFGTSEIGTKDIFYSNPIDLSTVNIDDTIIFTFSYAYKKKSIDNDEWLRFYISKDCGETWVLRKNIHGSNLSSLASSSSYTPNSEDWKVETVTNINSDYFVANFRYKFEFENDGGNNIFIDNINLYPASIAELQENESPFNLTIFPNPVEDILHLSFVSTDGTTLKITVLNALGQTVDVLAQNSFTATGLNTIQYNTNYLQSGIYFLSIESESGIIETVRFLKN